VQWPLASPTAGAQKLAFSGMGRPPETDKKSLLTGQIRPESVARAETPNRVCKPEVTGSIPVRSIGKALKTGPFRSLGAGGEVPQREAAGPVRLG
jgi:hypothetical protein